MTAGTAALLGWFFLFECNGSQGRGNHSRNEGEERSERAGELDSPLQNTRRAAFCWERTYTTTELEHDSAPAPPDTHTMMVLVLVLASGYLPQDVFPAGLPFKTAPPASARL